MAFIAVENANTQLTQNKLRRCAHNVAKFIWFRLRGQPKELFVAKSVRTIQCVIIFSGFVGIAIKPSNCPEVI